MADILIRGMEIPESCFECVLTNSFFRNLRCNELEGMSGFVGTLPHVNDRHQDCPLHPLQEGHGRLVDAERFRVILCRLKERQNDDVATHALNWAIECLDKMDTIIPAEGGTDECSEN